MNPNFLKDNKKILIIIAFLIIFPSVVGIIFAVNLFSVSNLHPPIIIESNADFISYGFPGNGTIENPYIIENFRIGATGSNSVGISISNINAYFIVKNCYVYTGYIGISLMEVSTGTAWIINNTCISSTGDGGGINLGNTINCTILGNTCRNFMQGIHTNYVSYCLIKLNTIENNNYQGINIRYSSHNVIINNTIKMNPQHGIALVGNANWNVIHHNILINNAYVENYDVDGRLTGSINSQAFDEGNNNLWYDDVKKQGNYWSDYLGIGNYSMDGPAGTEDIYPSNIT
jgi:parallel beta-helix repeat protein